MEYIGLYKKHLVMLDYLESENYVYQVWNAGIRKYFKTNSMLNAFAKLIKDLGKENIIFADDGEYWYKQYLKDEELYTDTYMEHAIGLSCKYDLKKLTNSKGKKLQKYKANRNYFNINPNCDGYEHIQKLVKVGWMKEYRPNFFKCTWQGIYWLECKYDLKIYEEE